MQLRKWSVVLLASLLAAMTMVPIVTADGQSISKEKILDMTYLENSPISEMKNTMDTPATPGILDSLSEYALVTVDSNAFMRDADNNQPIAFTIDGKKQFLNLKPIPSPIDKNAKIIVMGPNGESKSDFPSIKTYKGDVVGINNSSALFTVSSDVLLGSITIENTTYYLDQLGPGLREDGKVVHVLYNSQKKIVNPAAEPGYDVVIFERDTANSGDAALQRNTAIEPDSALSTTTVDLYGVSDSQFRDSYANPIPEISNMISQVNSAFSPAEVSINFKIYAADSSLTNTGAEGLLSDFRNGYRTSKAQNNCDLGFLFTGKNLAGDIGGAYGFNSNIESGWALAQMVPPPNNYYQATLDQRNILIAHEIGHNFGAMHDVSGQNPTPSWARPISWSDWGTTKYTAMWNPFMGDGMQLQFSTSAWWPLGYHGDANHDNRQVIINNKATVAGYH